MKFRLRKRNDAYVKSGKPIPCDSFVFRDKTNEHGYKLGSNGTYWSSEEHEKCGDFQFITDLISLIGYKLLADMSDKLPANIEPLSKKETEELLDVIILENNYYIEAGEDDLAWHKYEVYDKLKEMEDL